MPPAAAVRLHRPTSTRAVLQAAKSPLRLRLMRHRRLLPACDILHQHLAVRVFPLEILSRLDGDGLAVAIRARLPSTDISNCEPGIAFVRLILIDRAAPRLVRHSARRLAQRHGKRFSSALSMTASHVAFSNAGLISTKRYMMSMICSPVRTRLLGWQYKGDCPRRAIAVFANEKPRPVAWTILATYSFDFGSWYSCNNSPAFRPPCSALVGRIIR